MSGLAVSDCGPADFHLLGALHRQLLPTSQLSRLGIPFIADVYYPTLAGGGFGGAVIARVDGEPAGFASYTLDTPAFLNTVNRRKAAIVTALVKGMARHPVTVAGATLQAFRTAASHDSEPEPDIRAEFLTLGVAAQFRDPAFIRATGISVAKTLFRSVKDRLAAAGVSRFKLYPPAEGEGEKGPELLYRMMGAKLVWRGRARGCALSLFVCETGAAARAEA